jgi:hypothetical protein
MKKIYLFLILFSFQFFFTQTTYEKKVSDIKNSFFTKMGLSIQNSDIWNNWDFNNNSDFMKFLYDNDNNKYFNQKFLGNLKSNEGQNLTLTFLKQLQDAKKLKTQEDLKKENYINSDHYKVKYYAYNDIANWFKKDEFEKNEEFISRVNNQDSQTFFKKTILGKIIYQFSYSKNAEGSIDLIEYDADTELYEIAFKRNSMKIKGLMTLEPFEAKDLKENLQNYTVIINPKDLRLNTDYNFFPTQLLLHRNEDNNINQTEKNFTVVFDDGSPIIFTNDDFRIKDFNLKFSLEEDFEKAEKSLTDSENIPKIKENIEDIKNIIELSNYKKAYQEINENLKITPENSKDLLIELYQLRAYVLFKSENYKFAVADYSKVIELMSNENDNTYISSILLFRGICYLNISEKEKACTDFSKSVQLGNQDANNFKTKNCK